MEQNLNVFTDVVRTNVQRLNIYLCDAFTSRVFPVSRWSRDNVLFSCWSKNYHWYYRGNVRITAATQLTAVVTPSA